MSNTNTTTGIEGELRTTSTLHQRPSPDFLTQDHLSLAASTGDPEIVEAILRAGCSPSKLDALGETALHHAARLGLVEIVKLLVEKDAPLDAPSRSGLTALEVADEYGQAEAVSVLQQLGAAVPLRWQRPRLTETIRFLRFELLPAEVEMRVRKSFAKLSDLQMPLERAVLRAAVLPFYDDTILVAAENGSRRGLRERFVLVHDPGDRALCSVLKWTNEEIYEWNDRFGIRLSEDDVAITYLQFFFCFVRGQLGRFLIAERLEDLDWEVDASDFDRDRVAKHLEPIRVTERTADLVRLRAIISFKNALLRSDAVFALHAGEFIAPDTDDESEPEREQFTIGQAKLVNDDLLEEDLPVHVPGPPGPFG